MSEIITISTIIRAKVEDVFDTYLNPEDNRRWSTAGGGWSVGKVSIDPKVGGKWSIEFKDAAGVHDFEFGGVYTEIIPNQKIVYAMRKEIADIAADDRFGTVTFEADTPIKGNTTVTISFTTEDTNSLEQQRAGWSAILENFKKHTKRKYNPNNAVILKTIEIPVSSKKVWETLWSKQTYPLWTTSFCDGSCYEGELEYDKKVRFMSPDGSGLSSLVKVSIPYFQMSFEHLGSIVAEFEDLDNPEFAGWKGARETYTLTEKTLDTSTTTTTLEIYQEITKKEYNHFDKKWDEALAKIQTLCQTN